MSAARRRASPRQPTCAAKAPKRNGTNTRQREREKKRKLERATPKVHDPVGGLALMFQKALRVPTEWLRQPLAINAQQREELLPKLPYWNLRVPTAQVRELQAGSAECGELEFNPAMAFTVIDANPEGVLAASLQKFNEARAKGFPRVRSALAGSIGGKVSAKVRAKVARGQRVPEVIAKLRAAGKPEHKVIRAAANELNLAASSVRKIDRKTRPVQRGVHLDAVSVVAAAWKSLNRKGLA